MKLRGRREPAEVCIVLSRASGGRRGPFSTLKPPLAVGILGTAPSFVGRARSPHGARNFRRGRGGRERQER